MAGRIALPAAWVWGVMGVGCACLPWVCWVWWEWGVPPCLGCVGCGGCGVWWVWGVVCSCLPALGVWGVVGVGSGAADLSTERLGGGGEEGRLGGSARRL